MTIIVANGFKCYVLPMYQFDPTVALSRGIIAAPDVSVCHRIIKLTDELFRYCWAVIPFLRIIMSIIVISHVSSIRQLIYVCCCWTIVFKPLKVLFSLGGTKSVNVSFLTVSWTNAFSKAAQRSLSHFGGASERFEKGRNLTMNCVSSGTDSDI